MLLSIIVPILNESKRMPDLLGHLLLLERHGCEVILVDGGSHDYSHEVAKSLGFTVISSPPGRARQMNIGAQAAKGDALLFLHADTRLPTFADVLVTTALTNSGTCWGFFATTIEGTPQMLRVVSWFMNQRSLLSSIATGDQSLFMLRQTFLAVGGFPDQPLMEDIEISRRLKLISKPAVLREKVITSGRRWESRGLWKTISLMWFLRFAYWVGVPAQRLARYYR